MRTVHEIYEAYRIMPGLQMHQLRVAAVGATICRAFDTALEEHSVTLACLFHDMGNILKSDLTSFPEFLGDKPREYWLGVKQEYAAQYGESAHEATMRIGRELSLPSDVLAYMDTVGFSRLKETLASPSFERKITEYADLRVAPHGVRSMEERLTDARRRYDKRQISSDFPMANSDYDSYMEAARTIEQQIFERTDLTPGDITEETVQPLIAELRTLKVA